MSRTRTFAAVALALAAGVMVAASGANRLAALPADRPISERIVPFDAPDLVNPLRGQYSNLGTDLFPQANPAQQMYPPWPGTDDASGRFTWRELQPASPLAAPANSVGDAGYDFGPIDRAIAAATAQHKRFGFRVMSFSSCCEPTHPGDTVIAVPDWLRAVPGATETYVENSVTYVVPNWNSADYLRYFTQLLGALGRRYDKDERLAIFELSGYGDFSENHAWFVHDQLGVSGPSEADSPGKLGYVSQYGDQYITRDSLNLLVDANLRAFPDTQIVTTALNPAIVERALTSSPELARLRHPVGIRDDGLGAGEVLPAWASNEWSWYVARRDPAIDTLRSRFRIAPVITEWPSVPEMWGDGGRSFYAQGVREVIDGHVSLTASTGFPDQSSTTPMDPQSYAFWSSANKFAGYRYAVTGVDLPADDEPQHRITVHWTNFGVAPTYENWKVVYEFVDAAGRVARSTEGAVRLGDLVYAGPGTAPTTAGGALEPTPATTTDTVTTGDLGPGTYRLRVRVQWDDHKPDATHTIEIPPMSLALTDRTTDGSYPLLSVIVR